MPGFVFTSLDSFHPVLSVVFANFFLFLGNVLLYFLALLLSPLIQGGVLCYLGFGWNSYCIAFESMSLCWFFGLSDIYFCLSPLVFNPGDSYGFFLSCFLSGMFFPFSLVWLLLMGPMDSVVLRFSVKFDSA